MLTVAPYAFVCSSSARTWHILPDGSGDCPTIQAGIDSSAAGDTVLVACGTYLEHDIAMKSEITLRGETGEPECVVIDAEYEGRCLDCADIIAPTKIEGLTFTRGEPDWSWLANRGGGVRCTDSEIEVANCAFIANRARLGAGLHGARSTLTVIDCTFTSNAAVDTFWAAGGGIHCEQTTGTVSNCLFSGNSAFSTEYPGDGGGVFAMASSVLFTDCGFLSNSSGAGAGGMYSWDEDASMLTRCRFKGNTSTTGGGMYLERSYAHLIECTFDQNTAETSGGVHAGPGSKPILEDCAFEANESSPWGGGAIGCWDSQPVIRECLFLENFASLGGGGVNVSDCARVQVFDCLFVANEAVWAGGAVCGRSTGELELTGCTLSGNSAPIGGGVDLEPGTSLSLARTIVAFSPQGEGVSGPELPGEISIDLACCDVYGNAGGDWIGCIEGMANISGNLCADPMFCDPETLDFHVAAESPCLPDRIAEGRICEVIGAFGSSCVVTGTVPAPGPRPSRFRVYPSRPNPFRSVAEIGYDIPVDSPVRLRVYDVAGRAVRTIVERSVPAGRRSIRWDGRDAAGRVVPSGVYFCRVAADGNEETVKVVKLRE
jgi:hypothetical protein